MTVTATPATVDQLVGTWTLDDTHTRIGFAVRHAMVSKVRGNFNEFTGSVTVSESLSDASIEVRIVASSVDTRNAQRDDHLRSNDFFGSEEHPEIVFTSTSVTPTGDDTFDVTGDLSIRGNAHSITIPFTFGGAILDPYGLVRAGFEGSVVVSRKDFGIEWNAALEAGGVMVSDKVTLEFEVEATRPA